MGNEHHWMLKASLKEWDLRKEIIFVLEDSTGDTMGVV